MAENAYVRAGPGDFFKTAQRPQFWLRSAERLQAGAEAIVSAQEEAERVYVLAEQRAFELAEQVAGQSADGTGEAAIEADPPNYLPAHFLYAFAFENLLKALMVVSDPTLPNSSRLAEELKSHRLVKLAESAGYGLSQEERKLLSALTEVGFWEGRYPVPLVVQDHKWPRPELLTPKILPSLRALFERLRGAVFKALPYAPPKYGVAVCLPSKLTEAV